MSTDLFLYANGDSFVKGAELGDFLKTDFPGYYNFNQERPNHIHSWFLEDQHRSKSVSDEFLKRISAEEYNRNFVAKIQKKLNCNFLNSAAGGSSNDRTTRVAIQDLIEIKKQHKNIVAIIGTADPSRLELPNGNNTPLWKPYFLASTDNINNTISKYFLLNLDRYHRMLMFYKNAILLQDFCKVNSIKLLWIAGNGNIIKDNNVVDQKNIEDYKNFKEYVNFGYAIEMCEVAKDINIDVMCPGYHFSETVHDVVANSLLEKI
jgi:hypothetical protein